MLFVAGGVDSGTSSSGGGDNSLKGVDCLDMDVLSLPGEPGGWWWWWKGETAPSSSSSSSLWRISKGASFSSAKAICGLRCCSVGMPVVVAVGGGGSGTGDNGELWSSVGVEFEAMDWK